LATGKVETPSGDTIEIDLGGFEKRIDDKMKKYIEELKEYEKTKPARGKGTVEFPRQDRTKLLEQLRNVARSPITEQWTIVIPAVTLYEVAAHLRDYVFVSDIIKGKAGDIVYIPYVKDFDFDAPTSVGLKIGTVTGLIKVQQTVLQEWGKWTDIAYGDIEKVDSNVLDELNRTFAHAAVRAEDKGLMELIEAGTTSQYAGQVNRHTAANAFYATNIPRAIAALLVAGKEVHPGDCVLYLTATAYGALLQELCDKQLVGYARSDIIQKGIVEDYLGVRILVGGYTSYGTYGGTTTDTLEACFLFRGKRAVALAPKRDILIETDRQIKERKLRIAGSHTFGAKVLDFKEVVRIWTKTTV